MAGFKRSLELMIYLTNITCWNNWNEYNLSHLNLVYLSNFKNNYSFFCRIFVICLHNFDNIFFIAEYSIKLSIKICKIEQLLTMFNFGDHLIIFQNVLSCIHYIKINVSVTRQHKILNSNIIKNDDLKNIFEKQ